MKRKFFKIVLLVILLLTIVNQISNADGIDPNSYDPGGSGSIDSKAIGDHVGPVFNVIYGVSIIISVISVAIIGLKMIIGSAQEKAEFKKNLLPVMLGIFIVSSIFTIVSILANFANIF